MKTRAQITKELLDKVFDEIGQEKFAAIIKEVDELKFEGGTLGDYLEQFEHHYQFLCDDFGTPIGHGETLDIEQYSQNTISLPHIFLSLRLQARKPKISFHSNCGDSSFGSESPTDSASPLLNAA